MSCLSVKFSRVKQIGASFLRASGMRARFGLVCATDLKRPDENVLFASDGGLLTIEGGYLIVKQDG